LCIRLFRILPCYDAVSAAAGTPTVDTSLSPD
jgi:hypothetical protein